MRFSCHASDPPAVFIDHFSRVPRCQFVVSVSQRENRVSRPFATPGRKFPPPLLVSQAIPAHTAGIEAWSVRSRQVRPATVHAASARTAMTRVVPWLIRCRRAACRCEGGGHGGLIAGAVSGFAGSRRRGVAPPLTPPRPRTVSTVAECAAEPDEPPGACGDESGLRDRCEQKTPEPYRAHREDVGEVIARAD